MTTVTDKYIDSLYELTQVKFPELVILQAKKCLLDYLGVTFAGSTILKEKGNDFLDNSETGNVSVIGFNKKSNLYNAALINGMSAHIAELDDGARLALCHSGASIISALLSIAQQQKLNGNDLLKGIIVGYEAAIRLASAIQPSHRNKGYHATGTCGTIGVALGVGSALDFSKQQMKNALSAAATSSSGMLNVIKGGSELKPYNAGQAAFSGIMAALIAQAGFNGPSDVLAGQWGFIDMMTDKSNLLLLEKGFEEKYAIEKIYMKPYAACMRCHPPIEATLKLKEKYKIDFLQVKKINVLTYNMAANGNEHTEVSGITDAKMSIPFSIAVALKTERAGINEFTEKQLHDNEILALAKKVEVIGDDVLNSLTPLKRPAIVQIMMNNDDIYTCRVDLPKGEPENPLSELELNEKFSSLMIYGNKTIDYANEIASTVWHIETDLNKLLQMI